MSPRVVLPALLLSAVAALFWLSYGFTSAYQLFGSAALGSIFRGAATAATAILFVLVATHLVVRVGFAWLLQYEPTQLQRGLVVALLTFVAAAIGLAYIGLDLGTILTTSALVTAIVGLSVQPLLGSLMSGLGLHRLIRIGDGMLLNGEAVEIVSLNWRSVVARRPDGRTVVVPNARLADSTLEILARDRPVRAEVFVEIPAMIAPHRAHKLVAAVIEDFPEVDATAPIVVLPRDYAGSNPATGYRAAFWVSHYGQRTDVEGRVLRRIWYAFKREGLETQIAEVPDRRPDAEAETLAAAVRIALRTTGTEREGASEARLKAIIASGERLLYDDGERIVLPERLAGSLCVLIEGDLEEIAPARERLRDSESTIAAGRPGRELTRAAALAVVERMLATYIGPFARHAVARASAGGAGVAAICAAVAEEIDDPGRRQAFLREASPPARRTFGLGMSFHCQRDAAQRIAPQPPLSAVDHALLLVAPASLRSAD